MRNSNLRVALGGAGVAAGSFVSQLPDRFHVDLFEKARGPGGRASTRKHDQFGYFNHGAPFFRIRSNDFFEAVHRLHFQPQPRKFGLLRDKKLLDPDGSPRWHFGVSNLLVKELLRQNQRVRAFYQTEIHRVVWHPGQKKYAVHFLNEERSTLLIDQVVISFPAPQVVQLVERSELDLDPQSMTKLKTFEFDPCLAIMITTPPYAWDKDGFFSEDDPWQFVSKQDQTLASGKQVSNWVVHLNRKQSLSFLTHAAEEYRVRREELMRAFREYFSIQAKDILHDSGHFWRYSKARNPSRDGFLEVAPGFFVIGDYLMGSKTEGAYLSGQALSKKFFSDLTC